MVSTPKVSEVAARTRKDAGAPAISFVLVRISGSVPVAHRDATGRQLGAARPELAARRHGRWASAAAAVDTSRVRLVTDRGPMRATVRGIDQVEHDLAGCGVPSRRPRTRGYALRVGVAASM